MRRRPPSGSVRWRTNEQTGRAQWYGRVTLVDGSRPFVPLDPSIGRSDLEKAKACAVRTAEWFRAHPQGERAPAESVAGWFDRYIVYKKSKGVTTTSDMAARATRWILPGIADKPPAAVTAEDVERIVSRLDAAIRRWEEADGARGAGRLSPKSAATIWSETVGAFETMTKCKDRSLVCLATSPAAGVAGPDGGGVRMGPILYSDELVALLGGRAVDAGVKDVPAWRRRVWAVATYTMTRRSELAALVAADVDFAHGAIRVSKQLARRPKRGEPDTKKTKTRRSRSVTIEPNVRRLLEYLVVRPDGRKGRLLRVPPAEDYAELLRRDLWTVGVRDERLHTSDASRTRMTGHCLRDTGLTHMAVRGDSAVQIQWRAGHTDFKTTQGYLDRGAAEGPMIGAPLPPLPAGLVPEDFGSDFGSGQSHVAKRAESITFFATPTGIEGYTGPVDVSLVSLGETGLFSLRLTGRPMHTEIQSRPVWTGLDGVTTYPTWTAAKVRGKQEGEN